MRQRIALVRQELNIFVQDGCVAADGSEPVKQPVVHEGNGTLRHDAKLPTSNCQLPNVAEESGNRELGIGS